MKKITIPGLILAGSILFWTAGCTSSEEVMKETPKIPVQLSAVERTSMARPLISYGRLAAKREIKLSFKIPGLIARILVDEGQEVRKGALLASLNLSEIEAQVEQARSGFEKAARDLERVENLYGDKAATLEQYQNVQTSHRVAKAQLESAEFNLRFSKIHAPDRGRILRRLTEENELVGAGTPVFLFAVTSRDWVVRIGVSDTNLVRVNKGDPAEIRFDAYPDRVLSGTLTEIVESADPYTGTFELELSVSPDDLRLVSGFLALVTIFPSETKPYALIPVSALVEADGSRGYVYTVEPGASAARRLPVTVDFLIDERAAVSEGLDGIERIVSVGAPYLTDGAEIEIVENAPETAAR